MISNLPAIITTVGLALDIFGAVLVAVEVVKVFRGPTSIDDGDTGSIAGGTQIVPNPEFVKYERSKHCYMRAGLACLVLGFILQAIGTWHPIWFPAR